MKPLTQEQIDRMPEPYRQQIARQTQGQAKRGNKYHAVKCKAAVETWPELRGRWIDSKDERARAQELIMLQRAGEISDLEFQVGTQLSEAAVNWNVDFRYTEDGRTVYEDFKSPTTMNTARPRVLMNLWRVYGPALLRITMMDKGRIFVKKTIMPKGKAVT